MMEIQRRYFLAGAGGAAALTLVTLGWKVNPAKAAMKSAMGSVSRVPDVQYDTFESIYREKWTWDSVVKGSHFVNCWYQRGCNWNVYVKDGVVWREEQAGIYEQIDPRIPDYNPRGCQKGACYSERMYDASRLRYPLKRVGARGLGKWKRVSWDEALGDVADKIIDAMISDDGPGSIVWDQGTAQTNGGAGLGIIRTSLVLDTPVLDVNTEIGDHRPGFSVTAGKMVTSSSSDDLFYSDLIFIWGGNPVYTQIPQAHFINEARYNGAKIITIAPDFSASAVHADQWVPVKVGTDAALGLSMAHVMIEEGIYNKRYVQEQTDLPLLTRLDNGRLLRQSDLKQGGEDDVFYFYDLPSSKILEVPKTTLELGEINPALEGVFEVKGVSGVLKVRPVLAALREHLQQYRPELAVSICGINPDTIRDLARELARARAATCIVQSSFSKFYHGIEMERAQLLCFALAGQMGRKGAGYMAFPYLSVDSVGALGSAQGKHGASLALAALNLKMLPTMISYKRKGFTKEMAFYDLGREQYKDGSFPSSILWLYFQGGLKDTYGSSQKWDPEMKRPVSAFIDEALDKGWQFKSGTRPRIFMEVGGNVLRRFRSYEKVIEHLLPKLDLMVTVDWRMSNTALHSDYVFPAASWYEKNDITWATPLSPYSQIITQAVKPLAQARPDWEFHCLLLKRIQQRAKQRGIKGFKDRHGNWRAFDVYDEFTFGGEYTENNIEAFLDLILKTSTNVGGIGWEELKKKGIQRFTALGDNGYMNIGNATDVSADKTITAGTWHTEKKMVWPTLTRRLQFCIDQAFYEEMGEVLPVHRNPPNFGGNYPIYLCEGHARWSIHASWRDQKFMLQLNRGQPVIFINEADAFARGIKDGDQVRIYNDENSVQMQAKITMGNRPGEAAIDCRDVSQ